ncbi:hypothetical protein GBAR_LOCUS27200 [Geodia barretti]|uniref:Uncharacterized protein n=1 Tax=Geodia barretti TaxID=519541 RepID=A0AA35TKR9_GEOBA|nr:hypothetical protein GBAR_LOCUS27200 [Geodia barretti]
MMRPAEGILRSHDTEIEANPDNEICKFSVGWVCSTWTSERKAGSKEGETAALGVEPCCVAPILVVGHLDSGGWMTRPYFSKRLLHSSLQSNINS